MHWLAVTEAQVPAGTAWLSPVEAARAAGMRFTKRRSEYRLRRYAGKRAVSAQLRWDLDEGSLAAVEVLNRPGGAPYAVVAGADLGLDISLTDRAGAAVCLVGPAGTMGHGTLGVDLEIVEPRSAGFVADYLTASEQVWVREGGPVGSIGWDVRANLLWSAKESALKVLRVGLRADTRWVQVQVSTELRPDGWAPLQVQLVEPGHAASGEVFPGWWRRDGAYLLTLAARHTAEPPALLAGGADLAHARPAHSWLTQPLAE
ncbi:MAG TPA: 4'-phosphopantetheinyl transferase superfamily protein [Dermatophilaceae bacterium]|nr:4'-phosphopantetheinyl transferase superfamily protein [Dermatophilaceae bacterium]